MSIGPKVESALAVLTDEVIDALRSSPHMTRMLLRTIETLTDATPLIAVWEDDPTLIEHCVLAASCADVLYTLKSSILADELVDNDELAIAYDILSHCSYRYTWLGAYSHFEPLSGPDEVGTFLGCWEEDNDVLGGDYAGGAIIRPFSRLVTLASIITHDISLYNRFAQVTMLIAKLIVTVDGIDAAERQFLLGTRNLLDAEQQLVSIAIETADSHSVTEQSCAENSELCQVDTDKSDGQAESPDVSLKAAMDELNSLIGLPEVKAEVDRLANFLRVRKQRMDAGLPAQGQSLHFVFTGNPGTGKTTVARIIGRILHGHEVLTTPKVIETDRSGLCGGYIGQTAIKTQEVIHSAANGVLFIDEAYSLSKSEFDNDYGKEAIDTILKQMEDMRHSLVVIVAGYPKEMERFLKANPGLESRFTRVIHFDDYHVADMCRIFEGMCEVSSYSLTPEARGTLSILLNRAYTGKGENFGNARYVRNLYETTLGNHADRLASCSEEIDRQMLSTIEASDIPSVNPASLRRSVSLVGSKWKGECPECHKVANGTVDVLGKRVRCKCGIAFIFPWWNLVSATVNGLAGYKEFCRPEDLIGLQITDVK